MSAAHPGGIGDPSGTPPPVIALGALLLVVHLLGWVAVWVTWQG